MKLGSLLSKTVRYGVFLSSIYAPVKWWAKATDDLTTSYARVPEVTNNIKLSDDSLVSITGRSKIQLEYIKACYADKSIEVNLDKKILEQAGDSTKSYKLVAESKDEGTGFYGSLYKDEKTSKHILALSGVDFGNGVVKFLRDFDDGYFQASTGTVGQLKPAMDFAKEMQSKYGVDCMVGHSLGGVLAMYIKGIGICPNAETWIFDGSGAKNATIKNCARIGNISEGKVIDNLKNNTYSITVAPNSMNALGQQVGIALTVSNDHSFNHDKRKIVLADIIPLVDMFPPCNHIFEQGFSEDIISTDKLQVNKQEGTTNNPIKVTSLFLIIAALSISPELKRTFGKKSSDSVKSEEQTFVEKILTAPIDPLSLEGRGQFFLVSLRT
jgi:hypothetical protein